MRDDPRIVRRWFGRFFLFLVAAQALVAGGAAVVRSGAAMAWAWADRGQSAEASRLRHYPAQYLRAIDGIREHVGVNDFYLIVDAEPEEQGATYVANFFLAPRRGVVLGHTRLERGDLIGRRLAQRKLADWIVWVPAMPRPPELLDRDEAAARLRALP